MKNLTIVFLAAASLASVGCKKKGGAGEAMAKMSEFKDKMCACKDKKCADDVQAAMSTWSAESAKSAGDKKPEAPDEKTMKEMQEVGTKYGECMAKAMGAGDTTATGSDATKPAEPPKPAEPVAAAGDCNVKSDAGGFCFTGTGLTAADPLKQDDTKTNYGYSAGDKSLMIGVTKMEEAGDFDDEVGSRTTEGKAKKDMKVEDLPNGGKMLTWNDEGTQMVTVLNKKDMKLLFCRTTGKPTADPALVESCKSLRGL
jgi:hypothetical protein